MNKFLKLRNITLVIFTILGATIFATPMSKMATQVEAYQTESQLEQQKFDLRDALKAFIKNGGEISNNNIADHYPDTDWNVNNRAGGSDQTRFLTTEEAWAKLSYRVMLATKKIFIAWDGRPSQSNSGTEARETDWNDNNRIGNDASSRYLTSHEARNKLLHLIVLRRQVFRNTGGLLSLDNAGDEQQDTDWNVNNRIGNDHSSRYLTLNEANGKISFVNLLKHRALFLEWSGVIDYENNSDGEEDTNWNDNNKASSHDEYIMHLNQGWAKISYRRGLIRQEFINAGGLINLDNTSDGSPSTEWNDNNKINGGDNWIDLLNPEQANAKVNYQKSLIADGQEQETTTPPVPSENIETSTSESDDQTILDNSETTQENHIKKVKKPLFFIMIITILFFLTIIIYGFNQYIKKKKHNKNKLTTRKPKPRKRQKLRTTDKIKIKKK